MSAPTRYTLKRNPLTAALFRRWWDFKNRHAGRRFVFVATTGRSGTAFLKEVFETVPGCSAYHEAWPIMHGRILKDLNNGDPEPARRTYWVQKAVGIRRLMGEADLYVETNHLFVKSFAEFAVEDLGSSLSIIHLRRDPVSVARSILQLGAVPGTSFGNDWYLDHRAPTNVLKMEGYLEQDGPLAHPFFRCLWYWYEVEARITLLKSRTPQVAWHLLEWRDRIDPEEVAGLVRAVGKTPDEGALERLSHRPVNRQQAQKHHPVPALEELQAMHARFTAVLAERAPAPEPFGS